MYGCDMTPEIRVIGGNVCDGERAGKKAAEEKTWDDRGIRDVKQWMNHLAFSLPLSADFTFHQEIYIHQCFFHVYLFYPSYRSAPQFPAQHSEEWRTCWKIVNIMNCVQCHHLCHRNPIKCEVHLIFMQGTHQTVLTPRSLKYWCFVTPLDVSYRCQRVFCATTVPDFQLTRCKPIHSIYYTLRVVRWGSLKIDKVHVDCKTWLLSSP